LTFAKQEFGVTKAIQLGDFGLFGEIPIKMPIPVFVLDGNHENHSLITKKNIFKWSEKNVHFVKRGKISENCGFIGGALNVDRRQYGTPGKSDCNFVTTKQAKKYAEDFNKFGKLKFIFSHSCPHSIGVGMVGDIRYSKSIFYHITVPFGLYTGDLNDCGEPALTEFWNNLKEKPDYFIFGHFHQYKDKMVGDTRFICLDRIDGKTEVVPHIIEDGEVKSYPDKIFF
jgi:DNA repair exonuclease SbcCD nuclease subunit